MKKLQETVILLLAEHKKLKEEYILGKRENEKLKALVEEQNEKINDFQYKTKISKIVDYLAVDPTSSTDLRIKLDEYIKEIDYCIAYLNKEEL
ncbi:hypothetical protein R9C00_25585 [Flammeovirgaceae bacterium SG7u.111]|nr:hypothetical protein [Flammeovirgaceae bacterium SG7u.132]WPO35070.1 hypothetical protein R9C00_25585 [Flammeovirgaceae bacterium SG7u.111]